MAAKCGTKNYVLCGRIAWKRRKWNSVCGPGVFLFFYWTFVQLRNILPSEKKNAINHHLFHFSWKLITLNQNYCATTNPSKELCRIDVKPSEHIFCYSFLIKKFKHVTRTWNWIIRWNKNYGQNYEWIWKWMQMKLLLLELNASLNITSI